MDTQNDFGEIRPKFRGLITRLLADAFINEDCYEPLPDEGDLKDSSFEPYLLLQNYTKPFN